MQTVEVITSVSNGMIGRVAGYSLLQCREISRPETLDTRGAWLWQRLNDSNYYRQTGSLIRQLNWPWPKCIKF